MRIQQPAKPEPAQLLEGTAESFFHLLTKEIELQNHAVAGKSTLLFPIEIEGFRLFREQGPQEGGQTRRHPFQIRAGLRAGRLP